jgi:hypothetical protein
MTFPPDLAQIYTFCWDIILRECSWTYVTRKFFRLHMVWCASKCQDVAPKVVPRRCLLRWYKAGPDNPPLLPVESCDMVFSRVATRDVVVCQILLLLFSFIIEIIQDIRQALSHYPNIMADVPQQFPSPREHHLSQTVNAMGESPGTMHSQEITKEGANGDLTSKISTGFGDLCLAPKPFGCDRHALHAANVVQNLHTQSTFIVRNFTG